MKRIKRPERFLLTASVLSAQIFLTQLPVWAQDIPANSSFSQTIDSIFSDSDTQNGDQIYQKVSAMQNDETMLVSSDSEDAEAISDLIRNFENGKTAYFLNGSCDYSDSIRTEWDLEKQYMLFGFAGNETFLQFLPKISITDVSHSEKETTVGIYEWMTVKYRDKDAVSDSVSGYGYSFTLHISPDCDTVLSVSNTAANFSELKNEGVNITPTGITYEETGTAVQDNGNSDEATLVGASNSGNLKVSWTYNTSKASAYADTWAYGKNSDYTWWGDQGGDCANFVSQCLYAGGFPKTKLWYPDSGNWIGQNELRSYLNSIGAGKLLTSPKNSDLKKGDLVWYNWDGKGSNTDHVTICVGTDSSGVPLIDSHTAARKRVKWNYGGGKATYMVMQMKDASPDNVLIYRLYNPNSGEHFYTSASRERDYLEKNGWQDEGIGWTAVNASSNTTSIYRLYNHNSGEHFYTANAGEYNYLKKIGWKDEGVLCRVPKKSNTPIYRLYNPNAKTVSHHYTKNKGEITYLKNQGWKDEGIAWYSK